MAARSALGTSAGARSREDRSAQGYLPTAFREDLRVALKIVGAPPPHPVPSGKIEEITGNILAYLNHCSDLYHLMLAVVDDNTHRRLDSRFCTSLADARRVLGRWRDEYALPAQHVHDNSDIDLDILFAQMGGDPEDAAESREAGFIPGPNPADESGLRPRLVVPHPFLPYVLRQLLGAK